MKAYIKFVLISLLIGLYFAVTAPFLLIMRVAPFKTKKFLNHLVGFFARIVLKITGVKVRVEGDSYIHSHQNYFIVSNHLSYLDILVMSSLFPSCYVTSMEMKATPLLGQITTLAGCVFVERRNRDNLKQELKEIEEALHAGLNVVVFPEATSTNGETVIPFKRSLFQASINAYKEILPLTLEYKKLNGRSVDFTNRDTLFWYGDMDFAPHFLGLCKQKSIEVVLHVNPVISKEQIPECSGILRDTTYRIVRSKYQSLVGDKLSMLEKSENRPIC